MVKRETEPAMCGASTPTSLVDGFEDEVGHDGGYNCQPRLRMWRIQKGVPSRQTHKTVWNESAMHQATSEGTHRTQSVVVRRACSQPDRSCSHLVDDQCVEHHSHG